MIKNIIILVLAITVCLLTVYIVYDKNDVIPQDTVEKIEEEVISPVIEDLEELESIVEQFEDQLEHVGISKEEISEAIEQIKEYDKTAEYIVAVEIQNIDMPILKTTLHLPADETFYNSVEVGDILTEEQLVALNVPAEYLTGWNITIIEKEMKEIEVTETTEETLLDE